MPTASIRSISGDATHMRSGRAQARSRTQPLVPCQESPDSAAQKRLLVAYTPAAESGQDGSWSNRTKPRAPPYSRCPFRAVRRDASVSGMHGEVVARRRAILRPAFLQRSTEIGMAVAVPVPRRPSCGSVGTVKQEQTIKGPNVTLLWHCARCDHRWPVKASSAT
jgi:hypothetical protein